MKYLYPAPPHTHAADAPKWPDQVCQYLQDNYGIDKVACSNGAVGGTMSSYMALCYSVHVPNDTVRRVGRRCSVVLAMCGAPCL